MNQNWGLNSEVVFCQWNSAKNLHPSKGSAKALPWGPIVLLLLGYCYSERKLRFKFPADFSQKIGKKSLLHGWVGGWVGGLVDGWMEIFYPLRFSSNSSMLTSKMCWFKIWPLKLSAAFLSKLMSILIFKIENFKTTYSYGKWLKKFNDGQGVSAPRKVSEVFQKIPIEKINFRSKYMKNT